MDALASVAGGLDRAWDVVYALALDPVHGTSRFYWPYAAGFLLLALASYRLYGGRGPFRTRDFLAFCFPRRIYLHASARLDYQLYVAGALLGFSGLLLSGLTVAGVAAGVAASLEDLLGPIRRDGPPGPLAILGLTLGFALAFDLAQYVKHALQHRVPVLWALHKVHHSADVLTPITLYRKHPFSSAFGVLVRAAVAGPIQGALAFAFLGDAQLLMLFSLNAVHAAFHVAGSNLRHSHIWVSFGPALGRVFVSPAQHQIHHSAAPEHAGRNLGEVFALWDWIFGTLYVPRAREELRIGLTGEAGSPYRSLLDAWWLPLVEIRRLLARRTGAQASGARTG